MLETKMSLKSKFYGVFLAKILRGPVQLSAGPHGPFLSPGCPLSGTCIPTLALRCSLPLLACCSPCRPSLSLCPSQRSLGPRSQATFHGPALAMTLFFLCAYRAFCTFFELVTSYTHTVVCLTRWCLRVWWLWKVTDHVLLVFATLVLRMWLVTW